MKRDSLDKIVTAYFAAVAAVPFEYKGKRHEVRTLTVSPLILRGFTCPAGCGGCCPVFSLDYLPEPHEQHPKSLPLAPRAVYFNGQQVEVWTQWQDKREDHHCMNLNMDDGRCGVHGRQPFSCDFELIRFFHTPETNSARAGVQLFGRGHAMLRVDNVRGALCTITPATAESVADTRRKLLRLAQWCDWFGLEHRIHAILKWIDTGPTSALVLAAADKPGFFY